MKKVYWREREREEYAGYKERERRMKKNGKRDRLKETVANAKFSSLKLLIYEPVYLP
jgi:hypothetical protein